MDDNVELNNELKQVWHGVTPSKTVHEENAYSNSNLLQNKINFNGKRYEATLIFPTCPINMP